MDKKIKHVAMQLPSNSEEMRKNGAIESMLRGPRNIGHNFSDVTLDQLKIGEEMDGTTLWLLLMGKKIKICKIREDSDVYLLFEDNI